MWFGKRHIISAALLGSMSLLGGQAEAAIADDLVFAYDMEAVSGTTITDISGNNNDGTMAAGLTTGTTDPLSFSSQHLRTPASGNTASVGTGTQLTSNLSAFSFSIFVHDRGNAQSRVRFLTSYPGSGGLSNAVIFDTDNAGGGNKELRLFAEGGLFKSTSPNLLPPTSGEWQHYGVVYNAGSITFYVDGTQFGPSGTIGATQLTSQPHAWTLMNYPGDPASDYIPNADYDEAALWYRALSAQEMNDVYSQGMAALLIPEPGSVLLLGLGSALVLTRRSDRRGA